MAGMKVLGFVLAGVVVGFLLGTALGGYLFSDALAHAGFFDSIALTFSGAEEASKAHYGWVGSIVGSVGGWLAGTAAEANDRDKGKP